MPHHIAQLDADEGTSHQSGQRPVEKSGGQIPDANLESGIGHGGGGLKAEALGRSSFEEVGGLGMALLPDPHIGAKRIDA